MDDLATGGIVSRPPLGFRSGGTCDHPVVPLGKGELVIRLNDADLDALAPRIAAALERLNRKRGL